MFTPTRLLIYLSDICELVCENEAQVSWYNVSTAMCYIDRLPLWLGRDALFREGEV